MHTQNARAHRPRRVTMTTLPQDGTAGTRPRRKDSGATQTFKSAGPPRGRPPTARRRAAAHISAYAGRARLALQATGDLSLVAGCRRARSPRT
jgi:hypothetical protein